MSFVSVYVDDFSKAVEFYGEVLGLEKSYDAGPDSCFFSVGGNRYGLHVAGGARPRKTKPEDCHASFVLIVESAAALHQRLRLNFVPVVQEEPVDRGEGDYWFQFPDPAGNLLEALGGK